jgi:hypothetical protein
MMETTDPIYFQSPGILPRKYSNSRTLRRFSDADEFAYVDDGSDQEGSIEIISPVKEIPTEDISFNIATGLLKELEGTESIVLQKYDEEVKKWRPQNHV